MAKILLPRMCQARTVYKGIPVYCSLDSHDPMDDHEAVTSDGPHTWWDPTEGEPDE